MQQTIAAAARGPGRSRDWLGPLELQAREPSRALSQGVLVPRPPQGGRQAGALRGVAATGPDTGLEQKLDLAKDSELCPKTNPKDGVNTASLATAGSGDKKTNPKDGIEPLATAAAGSGDNAPAKGPGPACPAGPGPRCPPGS